MDYPYEYLDYSVRLSFRDLHGLEAIASTYEHIRSTDSHLHYVRDHIWGDGDPLFRFATAPGVLSRIKERGHRVQLDTQVPFELARGDEVELRSIRSIHHGFKDTNEWWEFAAFIPHHRASVAIAFPPGREPLDIEVNTSGATAAPTVVRRSPLEIVLAIRQPTVGTIYRVDWSW